MKHLPVFFDIAKPGYSYFQNSTASIREFKNPENNTFPGHIFPIRPAHKNQRIRHQHSFVTFHVSDNPVVLTTDNKDTLAGYRIPAAAKSAIKKELKMIGLYPYFVYGGLETLSRELDESYISLLYTTKMTNSKRTNSDNSDFKMLVADLDADLRIRDGEDHAFFAQFNHIDTIKHVVVAYEDGQAVGCGAIKEYGPDTMEVKRMFVRPEKRGRGIASLVLKDLESWAAELGYTKCILETGEKQPEAIGLYHKSNYQVIPNYGQYAGVETSVCFQKALN